MAKALNRNKWYIALGAAVSFAATYIPEVALTVNQICNGGLL